MPFIPKVSFCIFCFTSSVVFGQPGSDINTLLKLGAEVSEHDPDSAHLLFEQALKLCRHEDTIYLPKVYNRLSQAYSMKGDYANAAAYSFKSLKMAALLKDTIALIDANNNLGIDLMYQEDYSSALIYFYLVEKLATASSDSLRLGHAYNNIGLTLGYAGDTENELPYYDKAAKLFLAIGEEEGYANTLLNKATVLTLKKQFGKAEQLYKEALTVYERLNYTNAQSMVLQSMAENASESGNEKRAILFVHKALKLSSDQGFKTEMLNSLQLLSTFFEHEKQYDSALYYLSAYNKLNKEIFNAEKQKISTELDKKYQSELKEQQIKDLEQSNRIKDLEAVTAQQWQYGLIIFLILAALVIAVLYNRYQLKQRTAKVLDEKNVELEKLNGFKDRMFAVISHDLRNPINAFSTLMESLHQNVQHASKEELQEFLQSTLQSARDLQSLLNNLLEWALIQIGRLPFQPQAVPLTEVIRESNRHVELMADQKKIDIVDETNGEVVFADKAMLTIVVRNLLSNAIKFSDEDSHINISTKHSNNALQIAIRDQGVGMKPEEVSKLFKQEENTQSIGNSSEKGAGIGLLLSKELVEKNQGKIWVESELGKGSTFYIEVPAA